MTSAFWDTSALVSLCVHKQESASARQLTRKHKIVVWWCTPVEMRSAFARLARTNELSGMDHAIAARHLSRLQLSWREINPIPSVRLEAEKLVASFPLKAADALQLAAALTWAAGFPKGRIFIASDSQLLNAAAQTGFEVHQI